MKDLAPDLTRIESELVLLSTWPLWVQVLIGLTALVVLGLTAYNYRSLTPWPRRAGICGHRMH